MVADDGNDGIGAADLPDGLPAGADEREIGRLVDVDDRASGAPDRQAGSTRVPVSESDDELSSGLGRLLWLGSRRRRDDRDRSDDDGGDPQCRPEERSSLHGVTPSSS
jgi:hypothetical protein